MKHIWWLLMILSLFFGLLPASVAAKHVDYSFGLKKGNKTYEVPANTWVGMYLLNTAGNGNITKVELLVDDDTPTGLVRMAIYQATPCILFQDLGYATVSNGWVAISGLNIPVAADTYYYLAFDLENPNGIRAQKHTEFGSYSASWPYDADPFGRPNSALDMPPGGSGSSVQYVIKATIVPE